MEKVLFTISLFFISIISFSQTTKYQQGYIKSDGKYVQGHHKTTTDNTNTNNFTTKGNTNSYTGESGTKPKDYSAESRAYSSDKNIQTGPKGGQYYINNNGNKTYVPKK